MAPQHPDIPNKAAPNVPYYTPLQDPIAGTAMDVKSAPKLFQPLKIRGLEVQNRVGLSPMCQYSAPNGHHTDWHFAHLGGIVQRGPAFIMVEATSVNPEGRITPEDAGIWLDSHIEPFKREVTFAHSQGQKIGIQIGHAGRKASTLAPWLKGGITATKAVNGWPDNVKAPSAISYNAEKYPIPVEMTKADIKSLLGDFEAAFKRALAAGFDFIEIHAAHGYLLTNFMSPVSNKRTDEYGGSFENRTRLVFEIIDLARSIIPKDMPLFLRISATEWLEHEDFESWTNKDSIELAKLLPAHGVDLLDVSTGGNDPRQKITTGPAYQAPFAKEIKAAVGDKLLVSSVGSIYTGKLANDLLNDGLDMVMVARMFLKKPGLVFEWAEELGVDIAYPGQIDWAFSGRHKK